MAFIDECSIGDTCKVMDLHTATSHHGTITKVHKGAEGDPKASYVHVEYDDRTTVRVDPGFVTLDVGENDVEDFLR